MGGNCALKMRVGLVVLKGNEKGKSSYLKPVSIVHAAHRKLTRRKKVKRNEKEDTSSLMRRNKDSVETIQAIIKKA